MAARKLTAGRHGGSWRKVRATVLRASTICWLCGHDGADSADHLIPRWYCLSMGWDQMLEDPRNLAPAHHRPCPTCGQRCNRKRGAGTPAKQQQASRPW